MRFDRINSKYPILIYRIRQLNSEVSGYYRLIDLRQWLLKGHTCKKYYCKDQPQAIW